MDRPTKATKRRTEMMLETPSSPLETICGGFASEGRASVDTAEILQIWAVFSGISCGFWKGMVLLLEERGSGEVSERDEMWILSELRGFGLRMEEREWEERDGHRYVVAIFSSAAHFNFIRSSWNGWGRDMTRWCSKHHVTVCAPEEAVGCWHLSYENYTPSNAQSSLALLYIATVSLLIFWIFNNFLFNRKKINILLK